MRKFLNHFATATIFLSAIVGLIAANDQRGLGRALLVVVSLAVLYAMGRLAWPKIVNAYNAVRKYAALVDERNRLREQLERSQVDLEATDLAVREAFELGVDEGKMQIVGAARSVDPPPKLIAVTREAGTVVLIGKRLTKNAVLPGARFELQVLGTDSRKGVVEVLPAAAGSDDTVRLRCIEATVPQYWKELERRADSDATPPAGVRLVRYEVDWSSLHKYLGRGTPQS
jgi:hypothetical protein